MSLCPSTTRDKIKRMTAVNAPSAKKKLPNVPHPNHALREKST